MPKEDRMSEEERHAEQPRLEHRGTQGYVALPARVAMADLGATVDRAFPELFEWLASRGLEPAGAPFIRYIRVDMDRELELELGVPIDSTPSTDERVRSGMLPAGSYVVLRHVGPYSGLVAANAALQHWATEHGVRWQMTDDSAWRARLEHYLTDPSRQPDPARWQTELAYLATDE